MSIHAEYSKSVYCKLKAVLAVHFHHLSFQIYLTWGIERSKFQQKKTESRWGPDQIEDYLTTVHSLLSWTPCKDYEAHMNGPISENIAVHPGSWSASTMRSLLAEPGMTVSFQQKFAMQVRVLVLACQVKAQQANHMKSLLFNCLNTFENEGDAWKYRGISVFPLLSSLLSTTLRH